MHPILFKVGQFEVRSYGLMLVIGVAVAMFLMWRRAARFGINPEKLADLMIWVLLPGILYARLTFILLNLGYYSQHMNEVWSFQFQGLTSFGGVIGGVIGFILWSRNTKTPFWQAADTAGVPWLVGNAIGRIGCLLNGCCYGHQSDASWAVHVYGLEGRYEPAQVYESILCLIFAGVLLLIEKRRLHWGQAFGIAVIGFGLSRFIYEFWRAGTELQVKIGMATSEYMKGLPITEAQVMALFIMVVGAVIVFARRSPQSEQPVVEEAAA